MLQTYVSLKNWTDSVVARIRDDNEGATMVEYALLVALIGVFLIATIVIFRDAIGNVFTNATNALNSAPNPAPGN